MQPPRKILHVLGRMHRGGAELRTLEIMRNIDRTRYQLEFCALSGLPGELDDEILSLGGKMHLVRLSPGFPIAYLRLLRANRYDAVHSHVHYSSGAMLGLAASQRVPIRIAHFRSTHDGKTDSPRRRIQRRILSMLIDRFATDIVAVGAGALATSWRTDWRDDPRCAVIHNGIDLQPFSKLGSRAEVRAEVCAEFGLPEGCVHYIHVGSFTPQKNHEKLVRVFAAVRRAQSNARLLLVGRAGTDLELATRAAVARAGLSEAVVFAGLREDVPRLLYASDLMIFPSRREGLPGAVLESCAAGVPTLASDLPGIREIAGELGGVQLLPLDAADDTWASAAIRQAGARHPSLDETARRFRESSFSMDRSIEAYVRLWSG